MSSLWQMRFSILCLTWYCFELMTGTKMYSIKNSEGGKMEKHKVSWFSFGEWCTSFLSVKKCSDASLKSWPPFPRIFHTFWSSFGIVFQNHSKLSRKQSELHFFETFCVIFKHCTFSIFRTASLGFLIRTILLVHIISEVYGCSFFSQSVISFWSYTRLVFGTCSRCFRWFLWDYFLSMGHIIFSLCLIIWMVGKKAAPLFRSSPLLTLWPIWHCSFVMVQQHKLNDRSCDKFKDRCDFILLLTKLETRPKCPKVKMVNFQEFYEFEQFQVVHFMQ